MASKGYHLLKSRPVLVPALDGPGGLDIAPLRFYDNRRYSLTKLRLEVFEDGVHAVFISGGAVIAKQFEGSPSLSSATSKYISYSLASCLLCLRVFTVSFVRLQYLAL